MDWVIIPITAIDDSASQVSHRFEQIELDVASIRSELLSLHSFKQNNASEEAMKQSEAEIRDAAVIRIETAFERLQARVMDIEANVKNSKIQILEDSINDASVSREIKLLKAVSCRRMESLISAFLPFLSPEKTTAMARWLTENIEFNGSSTMRRIWSMILLVDVVCIFVQARFPNLWRQAIWQRIPQGWYNRLSTMRYCLEMMLIVQFGIAAQQLATHQTTIALAKSVLTALYNGLRVFVTKVVPTGLAIAGTATFATLLYRNRFAHQVLV